MVSIAGYSIFLGLCPDLIEALLVRSKAFKETGSLADAALAAKQAWLMIQHQLQGANMQKESWLRLCRDCEQILSDLGEKKLVSIP